MCAADTMKNDKSYQELHAWVHVSDFRIKSILITNKIKRMVGKKRIPNKMPCYISLRRPYIFFHQFTYFPNGWRNLHHCHAKATNGCDRLRSFTVIHFIHKVNRHIFVITVFPKSILKIQLDYDYVNA